MVVAFVKMQCLLFSVTSRIQNRLRRRGEEGQASAEYALVVLGAAFVAILVGTWARRTDSIGKLLHAVLEQVMNKVR